MNGLVIVLAVLLVIAIAVLLVVALAKKTLNAALGSLIALLGGLITALVSPSVEGKTDIALEFGPLGHITGVYLKSSSQPSTVVWCVAFGAISILVLAGMWMAHDGSRGP
jgi:hypothetical protein